MVIRARPDLRRFTTTRLSAGDGIDPLTYSVEAWSSDGNSIAQVLCRACHIDIAIAAYWAALQVRPNWIVRLRQGAHLIRERLPRELG